MPGTAPDIVGTAVNQKNKKQKTKKKKPKKQKNQKTKTKKTLFMELTV